MASDVPATEAVEGETIEVFLVCGCTSVDALVLVDVCGELGEDAPVAPVGMTCACKVDAPLAFTWCACEFGVSVQVKGQEEVKDNGGDCGCTEVYNVRADCSARCVGTCCKKRRFCRETLPEPSNLTRYCLFGRTSTTIPDFSHFPWRSLLVF